MRFSSCDVNSRTQLRVKSQIRLVSLEFLYVSCSNKMVWRCVVGGCSNTADSKKGVTLHVIPFDQDSRPEAVKRKNGLPSSS